MQKKNKKSSNKCASCIFRKEQESTFCKSCSFIDDRPLLTESQMALQEIKKELAKNLKEKVEDREDKAVLIPMLMIKHMDVFVRASMNGMAFCKAVDIPIGWSLEFTKFKKIYPRLIKAGLKPSQI